ncbi:MULTISPECIES: DUF5908 family protein [Dickeya]|uniref:DUF5908 family protein n=1 Tax=Dickeya TaxID=204037 RepID=UPI00039E4209|nr:MULTISPECIES: DUF5908 family protein [Dickeya]MBO8134896.1 hypothetical protein [Dickeya fangzhongdai]UGA52911.1 DUF5908 family protein [Dickeya fangzhongdai]ULR33104.1 DUF5908 family protein [Dickeya fangzhongdai]UMB78772.1 DUF5908 family protein [Dickeya fangzhongdai]UWH09239.1 hypothetical protein K0H75_09910 [Dickeya fangzhongdai]
MPVEIRELVIKTDIQSQNTTAAAELDPAQLQALKQRIVQECLRQLEKRERHHPLER